MNHVKSLAALLFCAVFLCSCGQSDRNATANRIGNNGRSIVYGIIQSNLEREALSLDSVWPSDRTFFNDDEKSYVGKSSSEYFHDLIKSEAVDNFTFSLFAGGGVPTAASLAQFLAGDNNIWSCFANFPEGAPDDMPFLFTKNLRLTEDDLRNGIGNLADKLDPNVKPFGNELVVVVQKGGGVQILTAKMLQNPDLFFGSWNPRDYPAATILNP